MKRKNIILISLFLIIALINISIVSAEDFEEVNISDSLDENLEIIDNKDIDNQNYIIQGNAIDDESISDNGGGEEILKSSNTATDNLQSTSYVDGKAYNQMSNPTIQTAINNAKDGDTIIITGTAYVHCHFIVNKKLTIISEVGTTMSPCPSNTDGSGAHGIFYISPEASGTVIKGFELLGNDQYSRENDYGIYIKGASNVQIVNCSISTEIADGIRLANATNTQITDSIIKDSNIGINIVDSTKTIIRNNNITNNTKTGINISGSTKNTTIDTNNITYNQATGISITTANYIYILNNFIAFNQKSGSGAGVYVNCNITKIEILGNLFKQNGQYGVLNDYRTRNMGWQNGAENLEVVNNNYFMGHTERTVYHIEYKSSPGGSFNYDSGTDTYIFVGEGGEYEISKTVVWIDMYLTINK